MKPPSLLQMVTGILGGIRAEPRNTLFMKETADHLFGGGCLFSVPGAGRAQMPLAVQGAILGGMGAGGQPL